jgi:predicted dehydrogenase
VRGTIGAAVIGFGFMGRTHAAAYERARQAGVACELRAICTSGPWAAGENQVDALGRPLPFDPRDIPMHTNVDAVLERDDIHAVSICTYTDTHVDLALLAIAAGKHVLIEKPVALSSAAIEPLSRAAAQATTLCAPALCMRYWPGWPWLRDRVREGTFGEVRNAVFQRISPTPRWAPFYADISRSGGALFDLHIHDADFVRWCFGEVRTVRAHGDLLGIRTMYTFDDVSADVAAEGAWIDSPEQPFRMTYRVTFDEAIVTFDAGRNPTVTLIRRGSEEPVLLPPDSAYDLQVRDFLEAIAEDRPAVRAGIADAVAVTRILEAESRSANTE